METKKIINKTTEQQKILGAHKIPSTKKLPTPNKASKILNDIQAQEQNNRQKIKSRETKETINTNTVKPFEITNGKINILTDDRILDASATQEEIKNARQTVKKSETKQTKLSDFENNESKPEVQSTLADFENISTNNTIPDEELFEDNSTKTIPDEDLFEEKQKEVPTFESYLTKKPQQEKEEQNNFEFNNTIPDEDLFSDNFTQAPSDENLFSSEPQQTKNSVPSFNPQDKEQTPEATENNGQTNSTSQAEPYKYEPPIKAKTSGIWKGGLKDATEYFVKFGTPLITIGAIAAAIAVPPLAIPFAALAVANFSAFIFREPLMDIIDNFVKNGKERKKKRQERKEKRQERKQQKIDQKQQYYDQYNAKGKKATSKKQNIPENIFANENKKDYSQFVDAYNNGQPLTKKEKSKLKKRAKDVMQASNIVYNQNKKQSINLLKQAKKQKGNYQESEEFLNAKASKEIARDAQDISQKIKNQLKSLKTDRDIARLGVLVDNIALEEDKYESIRTLYNKHKLKEDDFHAGQEMHGLKYMAGHDKTEDLYNKRSERENLKNNNHSQTQANSTDKIEIQKAKNASDDKFMKKVVEKNLPNDEIFTSETIDLKEKSSTKDTSAKQISPSKAKMHEIDGYSSDLPQINLSVKRNKNNIGLTHGEDGPTQNR